MSDITIVIRFSHIDNIYLALLPLSRIYFRVIITVLY